LTLNQRRSRTWTRAGYFIITMGWLTSITLLACDHITMRWLPATLLCFPFGAICFLRSWQLRNLEQSRRAAGTCHACGYTLNIGMHTCPECGQQRRV
jgi:hypothetical protein